MVNFFSPMSMQRVLETARKLGLPVIMTDVAGREPMVIMPLEQFEAMAGTGIESSRPDVERSMRQTEPTMVRDILRGQPRSIVDEFKLHTAKKEADGSASEDPEVEINIPIEERFFLEPDDGGSGI